MKKLSLLIALCMILTIGGVYATWIYSGTQVDSQTEPFVSKMGTLDHEGNSGTYSFSENSLDFAIEPNNQTDKRTTIVWGTGTMLLTFTPKADISDAALAAALNATITVEQASETLGTYGGQTIYTLNTFSVQLDEEAWQKQTGPDGDYYVHTITADEIDDSISVINVALPSEDDYNAFKTAIANVKFRVRVTPAAIPTT